MPEDGAPGVVVGGGTTRFVLYTSINSILQMLCCLLHIVGNGFTIFAVLTFGEIFANICSSREYILDDDDCPLNILMNHQVEKLYTYSTLLTFANPGEQRSGYFSRSSETK